MNDKVTPEKRSEIMRRVKSKNTQPELLVRRKLHSRGFRFRVHDGKLPGSPDLVFPKYKVALFIHGCFWHRHAGCRAASTPSTNKAYWNKKFKRTLQRDRETSSLLKKLGWRVFVVWECSLSKKSQEMTLETLDRAIKKKAVNLKNGMCCDDIRN